MFKEQKKSAELEESMQREKKMDQEKLAALQHEIRRLQTQTSQASGESEKRLAFLEKQNNNLMQRSEANKTELLDNRQKVNNLTVRHGFIVVRMHS